MTNQPSNHDLHVLLTEQKGDTKLLLSKVEDIAKWQAKHEKDDKEEHKHIHSRISSMKKYGGAIGIVSLLLGYLGAGLEFIKR